MRHRPGGSRPPVWVHWFSCEREVRRLRQRIFKATREGDWPKVRSLQSTNPRALAACLSRMPRRVARTVLGGTRGATRRSYPAQGRALRTETTINDTRDFRLPKRLTSLPALRQLGFTANRRLLGVQSVSHDPIRGAQAFTDLTTPILTGEGTRIPGLRFGDNRVHALLQALLIHRLLPNGFTNRDLRTLIAPLLGTSPEDITAGKMTYDLRRLRAHGLIERVPHSRRYTVTDLGLQHALLFTHAHDHLLRTGLAETTDPSPPRPTRLQAAARAYQAAFDDLTRQAHLAA